MKTLCVSYPSDSSHVHWTSVQCPDGIKSQKSMQVLIELELSRMESVSNGLIDCSVIDEEKAIILDQFSFWYRVRQL